MLYFAVFFGVFFGEIYVSLYKSVQVLKEIRFVQKKFGLPKSHAASVPPETPR